MSESASRNRAPVNNDVFSEREPAPVSRAAPFSWGEASAPLRESDSMIQSSFSLKERPAFLDRQANEKTARQEAKIAAQRQEARIAAQRQEIAQQQSALARRTAGSSRARRGQSGGFLLGTDQTTLG
jgi:hypothetical protein